MVKQDGAANWLKAKVGDYVDAPTENAAGRVVGRNLMRTRNGKARRWRLIIATDDGDLITAWANTVSVTTDPIEAIALRDAIREGWNKTQEQERRGVRLERRIEIMKFVVKADCRGWECDSIV